MHHLETDIILSAFTAFLHSIQIEIIKIYGGDLTQPVHFRFLSLRLLTLNENSVY